MHRVFPSSHRTSASARTVQLHRGQEGDSEEVVPPFMHVGTYPTRNFATLGPSELRPPFAGASGRGVNLLPSPSGTGQVSVSLHPLSSSQRPVFLLNSRSLLFSDTYNRIKEQINTLKSPWRDSFNSNVGTPSSEGTGSICRVPSSCFARTPWSIRPVHLCRVGTVSLKQRQG